MDATDGRQGSRLFVAVGCSGFDAEDSPELVALHDLDLEQPSRHRFEELSFLGQDTARITVGDALGDGSASGFGYEAAGTVVGGDIQLLSSVAPVSSGA